ncbi:MAG: hypothetical protein KKH41_03200 [Candidatus Thermoplasmatota archaeon]|nr:hypothetical protein [Candidatus Thermoplasmatota archaeon]MBU4591572.1 hypothetical protein [Candidatus Thermoplasmatota archaeon]
MKNGSSEDNHLGRKVIAVERYFYKRPNPNVIMIGRFQGVISEEQLKAAISKVRKRHPLLNARIRQEKNGDAYFITESVGEPWVQVIDFDSIGVDDLLGRAVKELRTRHSTEHGPLIRFVLFRTQNGFDLLVNSHHMICDGLSLYYLIRDIFVHLSTPDRKIVPLPEPVIVENNLPPSATLKNYYNKLILRFNKSWAKKGIIFDEADDIRLHDKFWKMEEGLNITHWNLSERQTSSLIQRCRKENISVHSALCTAFLLAQIEVQGKEPYLRNISMPVSIRNRLAAPVGEAFGLYFSSFKIKFKRPKEKSFWANALAVHEHIQQQITDKNVFTVYMQLKDLHPTLVDSISFTRYGELEDKLAKRLLRLEGDYTLNTGLDLSNLGVLEMPDNRGLLILKDIIGPCCYNEFQEKYLGVVTLGKMYFTVTYREPVVSKSVVESLKKVAMKHLGEAVGW